MPGPVAGPEVLRVAAIGGLFRAIVPLRYLLQHAGYFSIGLRDGCRACGDATRPSWSDTSLYAG